MPGLCEVPWCDQGTRPHTVHEWTVTTELGTSRDVTHGRATQLVIIDTDTQDQAEIVLGWDQVVRLLDRVEPARRRVLPCTCPPNGPDSACPRDGGRAEEFFPEPDAVPPF